MQRRALLRRCRAAAPASARLSAALPRQDHQGKMLLRLLGGDEGRERAARLAGLLIADVSAGSAASGRFSDYN